MSSPRTSAATTSPRSNAFETVGARIEHNVYETRWFGIHLLDSHASILYRNRAWRTMRAVDVEGGRGNRVEKQLAEHCDSGVVVEGGADATTIVESWLHDCRVGVFVWRAEAVNIERNAITEPRDHAAVVDRNVELEGNQLDGDVWSPPA